MMDQASINALTREASEYAEECELEPLYVSPGMLRAMREGSTQYQIPHLGEYVPDGWNRTDTEEYFCDTSGMGQPGERALTVEEFLMEMEPGYGYAITEAGQFQCYVAQYKEC